VAKNGTARFSAEVAGTATPAAVTWSVAGAAKDGTAINAGGLLTVAADETAQSLTVKATSTADGGKLRHGDGNFRQFTSGGGPVGTNQHPVTEISWRDAVVWCNAYSEAVGKTPYY
jgi:formylglycine-generating enzyme required for sulfatase activity